jgi:hypothetical protein
MKRKEIFKTPEGYVGVIVFTPMGFYNGYVGVPPKSPLAGLDYSSDTTLSVIDVHGGITYSAYQNQDYTYPTDDVGCNGWYFYGFDTGHFSDKPNYDMVLESDEFTEDEKARAKSLKELERSCEFKFMDDDRNFKDRDYVYNEVLRLSKALKSYEENLQGS